MLKLFVFLKALFVPMCVSRVMSDFDKKVSQLEAVADFQREQQAKQALKVQKALEKQNEAELEEVNATHTINAIKTLLKKPQAMTLNDLKKDTK